MFVMTTKVDKKKILIILGAVLALAGLSIALFAGGRSAATMAPGTVNTNDDRVRFLESFGWEVATSPEESGQVRIPAEENALFSRYNTLQKSMGYDLGKFAGKTVMRYVYKIQNYPGATANVYATLLICENKVIGGDITDTSPGGKVQGFEKN